MEVNLPIFEGEERNTLYFIGNGFDLFHGVKSKFIHFYSWLNLKDEVHEQFANDMEELFTSSCVHGNLLWRDFEEALGKLDVDGIHNRFSGQEENIFYDEEYQKRASQCILEVTNRIPVYLREWIKDTNISEVQKKLALSKKSIYFTFNYTLLLENVYEIPREHILHIHNSLMDSKPLITGHLTSFREKYNDNDSINIERSKQNIIQEANRLRKPVDKLIDENRSFFDSLANIKYIVVFGHSLSEIDRRYFTEVVNHVHDDAHWYFVVKDDEAEEKYMNIIDIYCEKSDQYIRKMKRENCSIYQVEKII